MAEERSDSTNTQQDLVTLTTRNAHLEERIRQLEAEVEEQQALAESRDRDAEERARRVSFRARLLMYRATYFAAGKLPGGNIVPLRRVNRKLRNYSFAQSHGVSAPDVYALWPTAEEINLSAIEPDAIVLKSDGGHSALGVLPLQRDGDSWQTLDGLNRLPNGPLGGETLERFSALPGPYFAEELLRPISGHSIPEDVKLYMSRGEFLQGVIIDPGSTGTMNRRNFPIKFIDEDGEDLGKVSRGLKYDHAIRVPDNFDELKELARKLSIKSGLPFVRVDLYPTSRGAVFGELTLVPGSAHAYTPEHDEFMGLKWATGEAQLERDLARGRPSGYVFGHHDFDWHYPKQDRPIPNPDW
ncbi:hypothetical protein GQF49_05670 [Microbacter sp. ANSKLAB05]|nr:hypothetical protein [Microbacter sp. ANSKLAB05]